MTDGSESTADLAARVAKWAETAGFALELRVARAFMVAANARADINVGVPYFDGIGEKWREVDVVAVLRDRQHSDVWLKVVIECKSGKRKPWVVLADHRRYVLDEDAFGRQLKAGSNDDRVRHVWANGRGNLCWPTSSPGYAITEATLGATSQPDDQSNVPYRAVRQVVAAATVLTEQVPIPPGADAKDFALLTIPIVITAADIFECGLDDTGALRVLPTDYTTVYVKPDAPPAGLRRQAPEGGRPAILVHVMSEQFFADTWAPELVRVLARMADR